MNGHVAVAPTPMKPHDCGCGCGGSCGCDSRCCDLDCLVRPNFYCGQLLTDADMTALVDWTRKRFALSRYRDGWGVVCGLHVTCTQPDDRGCCDDDGPKVYVRPGYAVDCCGNDLVVCEPLTVDLSGVCRPDDDPCAPGYVPKPPSSTPQPESPQPGTVSAKACLDRLKEGVFAVDLYLRYQEDLGQGQRPLLGRRCGHDSSGCEYARVLERPCVHVQPVPLPTEQPAPGEYDGEFKGKLVRVIKAIDEAVTGGPSGLRSYLRQYPPARFCFIDDLVCCLLDVERGGGQSGVADIQASLRFWLLYDWFLQQLDCDCASCTPDTGVPLARLYLRRSAAVPPVCTILMIDDTTAYRRRLTRDECVRPPSDSVDLRRYFYLSRTEAGELLEREGIALAKGSSEKEAMALLSQGMRFVPRGQRNLQAHFVKDPRGVERLAAFSVRA